MNNPMNNFRHIFQLPENLKSVLFDVLRMPLLILITLFLSAIGSLQGQQTLYWRASAPEYWIGHSSLFTNWSLTAGGAPTLPWTATDNSSSSPSSAIFNTSNPEVGLGTNVTSGGATYNIYVNDLTIQNGMTLTGNGNPRRNLNILGAGTGDLTLDASSSSTGFVQVILSGSSAYNGNITAKTGSSGNNIIALDNTTGSGNLTKIRLEGTGSRLVMGAALSGQKATIGELSGSAGSVIDPNTGGGGGFRTLEVSQTTNTVFAGEIRNGSLATRLIAFEKSGSGQLTLAGNNTYTGTTTVAAGTLLINGATSGQGNYEVQSGARLGGDGEIGLAASSPGTVTVESGGILAPGDASTAGTLEITGGNGSSTGLHFVGIATIEFRLGATQDMITLSNTAMTGSASGGTGSVAFDFLDEAGFQLNQTYDLISFGGTSAGIALDTFALSGDNIAAGWIGTFSYGGDGNMLQFTATAVPEPATSTFLLLSALAGFIMIRKKCRFAGI